MTRHLRGNPKQQMPACTAGAQKQGITNTLSEQELPLQPIRNEYLPPHTLEFNRHFKGLQRLGILFHINLLMSPMVSVMLKLQLLVNLVNYNYKGMHVPSK